MDAAAKIKGYLKHQIQKGKITKNDLLKIEPKHLMKIALFKDMEHKEVSETLEVIKLSAHPELVKKDIRGLFEGQKSPLEEQINDIMKG
jgi:hypothetical protein